MLPAYLVDEYFIIYESVKHKLEDLRSANLSGSETQELAVRMGKALTNLRQAARRGPKCTFSDLVKAGQAEILEKDFNGLMNQGENVIKNTPKVETCIDDHMKIIKDIVKFNDEKENETDTCIPTKWGIPRETNYTPNRETLTAWSHAQI